MSSNHHAPAHAGNHADHHEEHAHAGPKLYWIFAVILCLITFGEWAIFNYKTSLGVSDGLMVVVLVLASIVKFIMVCGWYMHLRFDNKMLTWIFVFSAFLATGVFAIMKLSLPTGN
jgi:cytochrome c oxidase subunit IV